VSLIRFSRGVRNLGGFAGGTSRLARPPQVLQGPDKRPRRYCPCPYIELLPYDPWEFMVSGWLNWEGDKIYVGDAFSFPVISEYTFPGLVYIKDVVTVSTTNVLAVAAGRDGAVYSWEDGTFNGTDYDWDLYRHDTDDDSNTLILSVTRPVADPPTMIYDTAQAVLYTTWNQSGGNEKVWRIDGSSGAYTEIWTLTGSSVVTDLESQRPAYTLDGLIWYGARDGTDYGLLSIDPGTSAEVFYPIGTGSVTDAVSDGTTVYVDSPFGSHWKIKGGVVSAVTCDYQGSQPYYGVIDSSGVAYYQWFGDDMAIWWWNC
jgi:hypothetical protein